MIATSYHLIIMDSPTYRMLAVVLVDNSCTVVSKNAMIRQKKRNPAIPFFSPTALSANNVEQLRDALYTLWKEK